MCSSFSHYLQGFRHPFGGFIAGFLNHQQGQFNGGEYNPLRPAIFLGEGAVFFLGGGGIVPMEKRHTFELAMLDSYGVHFNKQCFLQVLNLCCRAYLCISLFNSE